MKGQVYKNFLSRFQQTDSLEEKLLLVWDFTEIYYDSFRTELTGILEEELEVCLKNNHLNGEIIYRVLLSRIYADNLQFGIAMQNVEIVRSRLNQVDNPRVSSYARIFLSIMEMYLGNYDAAFNLVVQATKEYEGFEKEQNYGWCHYSMGIIYSDLKDFENAEKKFLEAHQHFSRNDYSYGIARSETGIATLYLKQGKTDKAEKLFLQSVKIFDELEVTSGSSRVYNDLGELNKVKGDFATAEKYLSKAINIRRGTEHWQGLATSLNEMADIYLKTEKPDNAIRILEEAVDICTKINNRNKLFRAYYLLYQGHKMKNNPEKALHYFESFHAVKEEATSVDLTNRIKKMEKQMATEKAEKETELERIRNTELKYAYDLVEEKNKEILDSINYAKRIQYTLIASDKVLQKFFPQHFVLFQPKDIVSGDFYWFTHNEEGTVCYLAVCDSTGHGVPGAFMSLLNITYLNEAINEKNISEPGKILDYVREKLVLNISHDGAKDGMDATLMKFEKNNSETKITYAAAHNSPFVVRNGQFLEMPFDKMPVGKDEKMQSFGTFPLPVQQGDMIYLGTDGYADQFGGEKFNVKKTGGKKFKKANLKKLLASISAIPAEKQKEKLATSFEDWRGDLEQVDDVLIIGLKF
ncbi:MAG: tetratricopeptide repeat protein [Bacteroidota bacterium]